MSRKTLFTLALLVCLAGTPAVATTVVPLYLDQIVDAAAVAFEGTCIATRSSRDPQTGVVATFTTFRVDDVLKGNVGVTHTIKQLGGEIPEENVRQRVLGVPHFAPEQRYVVFLPPASASGFSSPIGLAQGRFFIGAGPDGPEVGNGRDFRELASRFAPDRVPLAARLRMLGAGPVNKLGLAEFKEMVRNRVGAAQ